MARARGVTKRSGTTIGETKGEPKAESVGVGEVRRLGDGLRAGILRAGSLCRLDPRRMLIRPLGGTTVEIEFVGIEGVNDYEIHQIQRILGARPFCSVRPSHGGGVTVSFRFHMPGLPAEDPASHQG